MSKSVIKSRVTSVDTTSGSSHKHQQKMEVELERLSTAFQKVSALSDAYQRNYADWTQRAQRLAGVESGELDGQRYAFEPHALESLTAFRDIAQAKADAEKALLDETTAVKDKVRESRDSLKSALARMKAYNTVLASTAALGAGTRSGNGDLGNIKELLSSSRRAMHEANALIELRAGQLGKSASFKGLRG